jgi:glycosyltransferase involved in cell wall biosynthesis
VTPFWRRNPNRWRTRGDAARDACDWRSAIRLYEKHLARHPQDEAIQVQLGHAYKEAGIADRALAAYETGLEVTENPLPIQRVRALLLRDMGRLPEAANAFAEQYDDPQCRSEALRLGAFEDLRTHIQATATANTAPVWLEIGDLIKYHVDHPRPSGVQRVIAESVERLLRLRDDIALIVIAEGGLLQEISPGQVRRLVALTGMDGDVQAYAREVLDHAPYIPAKGEGVVLTFGAFWTDPGFFEAVDDMRKAGRALISMIHDLIPLTHPEFAGAGVADQMGPAFQRLCKRCDWMIAVSERTRAEMTRLGCQADACSVVPLCHDFACKGAAAPRSNRFADLIGVPGFVLCVGTIEPRKNHELLLRLWRAYQHEGLSPPPLVLAGREGWGTNDLVAQLDEMGAIIRLGPVSDAELAWLYQDCALTVFPSFVEGWGLPPGESLVNGKVCVASAAVAEVSDALLHFDPNDLQDLRRVLDPLLFEAGALETATAEAKRAFSPRGWDDVAADIALVISDRLNA